MRDADVSYHMKVTEHLGTSSRTSLARRLAERERGCGGERKKYTGYRRFFFFTSRLHRRHFFFFSLHGCVNPCDRSERLTTSHR